MNHNRVNLPHNPNLLSGPAEQFRVDPADYPIFREQTTKPTLETRAVRPLDDTLATYVSLTADTVAAIAGETGESHRHKAPEALQTPFDHVIYLDKSARPVCWLVNVFWDDFSSSERPPHSFLSIDRAEWFRRVGLNSSIDGRDRDTLDLFTPGDFAQRADSVSLADRASIHALYVDDGVNTEDPDAILDLPTSLDGKRVLIVDEVSRTGSTLEIAATVLKQAIPNVAEVATYEFYHKHGVVSNNQTGERELSDAPIWYNRDRVEGRGIGEIRPDHYEQRYLEHPNPRTLAQRLGARVLASPIDLRQEAGQASRELAREIKQMRRDFDAGKIFFTHPDYYSTTAWRQWLTDHGLTTARTDEAGRPLQNSYAAVKQALEERPPAEQW